MKHLDWSEAIWEAWISFEQLYGSVEEIDYCLDKIEKAQYQVNTRRAKVSSFPLLFGETKPFWLTGDGKGLISSNANCG